VHSWSERSHGYGIGGGGGSHSYGDCEHECPGLRSYPLIGVGEDFDLWTDDVHKVRYLPGTKDLLTTPAWWVRRGAAALAAKIIVPSTSTLATYARRIKPDEDAYRAVIGGPLD
jgi:hypothetical protein